MEKRFVLFLVLSIAVIFGYLSLVQMLNPRKPPDRLAGKTPQPKEQAVADKTDIPPADTLPNPAPTTETAAPETTEKPAVEQVTPPRPQQWASLGSFAGDQSGPLHVILSSRGAAIERIELTERTKAGRFRYRNLDQRSGYLAHWP